MLTKVKKIAAKEARISPKEASPARHFELKETIVHPGSKQRGDKVVVDQVAATPKKALGAQQRRKASVFPDEFFAVMDEMQEDTQKRRSIAVKAMKAMKAR